MRWAYLLVVVLPVAQAQENPAIDMPAHLRVAAAAAEHRASRRVSEAAFVRMAREPGTVILDARSAEKYRELHVRGAVNLSFPDITVESLRRLVPDPATRILIYCNNNFVNAEGPFPTKLASASLNLSTYIALYDYGYRNVYELGPTIDPSRSLLDFQSGQGR
jgi:hypothetical protein